LEPVRKIESAITTDPGPGGRGIPRGALRVVKRIAGAEQCRASRKGSYSPAR